MTSRGPMGACAILLRSERGLTILELLLSLIVFGIISGGMYGLFSTGIHAAGFATDSLQSQGQVRVALDTVVDEARWAQQASAANATSVTLFVPQSTPFSPSSPYTVTFAYDAVNKAVTRTEGIGPAVALAYNVAGLALTYFDAAGAALGASPPDASAVALIHITVTTASGQTGRVLAGNAALRGR